MGDMVIKAGRSKEVLTEVYIRPWEAGTGSAWWAWGAEHVRGGAHGKWGVAKAEKLGRGVVVHALEAAGREDKEVSGQKVMRAGNVHSGNRQASKSPRLGHTWSCNLCSLWNPIIVCGKGGMHV